MGLAGAVAAANFIFGPSTAPQVKMEAADAATQGFSVVSKNYPADAPRPQTTQSTGYCESDPASYPATDAVRQALTLNYSFTIIQDGTDSKDKKTGYAIHVTATSWGVFGQKNDDGTIAYGSPVGALDATAVVDKDNHLTSLTIELPEGDGHP